MTLMSPYPPPFLNGASAELAPDAAFGGILTQAARRHVDTLSVYGLERWTADRRRALIDAVIERGMGLVPRIEAYDPATFAFRAPTDVDAVVATHGAGFLRDLADAGSCIPYVVVNMPVDDQRVTDRLGGRGSRWRDAQVGYAAGIIRKLRAQLGDIPLYLGVFYGWDGSYELPSYAGAGADGYVLTSYPYPGNVVAGHSSPTDVLIDKPRLTRIADRFAAQYPGAPCVVEYGLQTMNGRTVRPGQTAGLVLDKASKQRALTAITRLYREGYPQVRGTMYFGLNITKREGDPPVDIDWSLI